MNEATVPAKLVLVISEGPMGSSVVAGFVEKFGYLQFPFRNYGLLSFAGMEKNGKKNLRDQLVISSEILTRKSIRGGVSIEDRDSSRALIRVDSAILADSLAAAERQFDQADFATVYDLYRCAIGSAIIYKSIPEDLNGHVELITGNDTKCLVEELNQLEKKFEDVKIIALKRDFVEWIESLARARFTSTKWKNFLLSDLVNRFGAYHENIKTVEERSLIINFDDLFGRDSSTLLKKLASHLEEPDVEIFPNELIDVFGKMVKKKEAVSLVDKPGRYFSLFTKKILKAVIPQSDPSLWLELKVPRWKSVITYCLYFFELSRFYLKRLLRLST